jgi:hypothetical protein
MAEQRRDGMPVRVAASHFLICIRLFFWKSQSPYGWRWLVDTQVTCNFGIAGDLYIAKPPLICSALINLSIQKIETTERYKILPHISTR